MIASGATDIASRGEFESLEHAFYHLWTMKLYKTARAWPQHSFDQLWLSSISPHIFRGMAFNAYVSIECRLDGFIVLMRDIDTLEDNYTSSNILGPRSRFEKKV